MKIKVVVPESLADIKARDYAIFMQQDGIEQDPERLMDVAFNYFVGIDPKDRKKINYQATQEIAQMVLSALNEKPDVQRIIELNGVRYGFHPDLERITLGEFVDLDEAFKNPYKNWQAALGILYRPITNEVKGRYEVESYDPNRHTGKEFAEVSASVLVGALLFFYKLEIALAIDSLQSLEGEVKKGKHPQLQGKDSERSGDGLQQSIHLLKEIYSKSKG